MEHFFNRDYAFKAPKRAMAVAVPFHRLTKIQIKRNIKMKLSNEGNHLVQYSTAAKRAYNRITQREIDPDQFFEGQNDCKKGIAHKAGNSSSYDRGYSTQYELEAYKDEVTKNAT